jgi:putative transcriptional regulator
MSKKDIQQVMASARAALAHAKGDADAGAYRIHVPNDVDVKEIRRQLKMSQPEFCSRFGFGLARVRDWEQGRSKPDGAMRVYLMVIRYQPRAVERALKAAA